MNATDSDDESDISQPSSLVHLSPPTSPPVFSPPTSPLPFIQEDSNSLPSPLKRRKRCKNKVSRSTILRRRLRVEDEVSDSDESFSGEEIVQSDNQTANCNPSNNDNLELNNITLPLDVDGQANDLSQSESESSESESISHSSGSSTSSSSSNGILSGDSSADNNDSDSSGAESADSEEGTRCLYSGTDITLSEAMLEVLKLYIQENWTKNSLDKNVKLIRKLLPIPNEFPHSGKDLIKKLEALTCSYTENVYHQCTECEQLVPENNECGNCNCKDILKFYSFPLSEQIRHMFEHRSLADIMDYHRVHHGREEGYICDVQDGSEYKRVRNELTGQYDITLLWSTDGVALSNSSNRELWPIVASICEVPFRLRSSYMLVCGVYVGTKKPNMNVYLKPFVDSLVSLYENGVSWLHPSSKLVCSTRVAAPLLTADAPAKAQALCHGNFNHRYGCLICEQKSKKVELTTEEIAQNEAQVNPRKRIHRKRRFVYQDDVNPARLRTRERLMAQSEKAENTGNHVKGVISKAIVCEIPLLDRAQCVCAEYMHLVLLGVVKYFLLIIFLDKGGPWYLGNQLHQIEELISNIKVPDFIKRLPRKIKDLKYWKASELRNFLLYYSLPLFQGLMSPVYFEHWFLLVASVQILLKDKICKEDLRKAEIMLRAFVRDVGALYGDVCYTYNVHSLLHICLQVERAGPLWSTSVFSYESFYGFISSHIHGTKHFGQELINNMKIFHSVTVLETLVSAGPQNFPKLPCPAGTQLLDKALNVDMLTDEEKCVLPNDKMYVVHHRVIINGSLYSSKSYDLNKKRLNSIIQFSKTNSNAPGFGQIIAFLKTSETGLVDCLIREFQILHRELFHQYDSRYVIRNLLPYEALQTYALVSDSQIIRKIIKVGKYLAIRPNEYEINL